MSFRFADRKLSVNLYDIYHCCVYSEKIPDGGQRNCPRHVKFYSKNKFEKLVHIVGFIIRVYQVLLLHFRIPSNLFSFDTMKLNRTCLLLMYHYAVMVSYLKTLGTN